MQFGGTIPPLTEVIGICLSAKHEEVVDNVIYGNAKPIIYIRHLDSAHMQRIFNNLKSSAP
jgi:hypothetical protein